MRPSTWDTIENGMNNLRPRSTTDDDPILHTTSLGCVCTLASPATLHAPCTDGYDNEPFSGIQSSEGHVPATHVTGSVPVSAVVVSKRGQLAVHAESCMLTGLAYVSAATPLTLAHAPAPYGFRLSHLDSCPCPRRSGQLLAWGPRPLPLCVAGKPPLRIVVVSAALPPSETPCPLGPLVAPRLTSRVFAGSSVAIAVRPDSRRTGAQAHRRTGAQAHRRTGAQA
jgi:hypothetical protein